MSVLGHSSRSRRPEIATLVLVTTLCCPLTSHTLAAQPAVKDSTPRRLSCASPRPLVVADTIPHCLPRIEVLAEGNIKDVLGGSKATATAAGSLGLQFVGNRHIVTGMVNVAGTEDTVRTGYGATLLVPAAGKGLNAGMLALRTRFRQWSDTTCGDYDYAITCNLGVRLRADASTRRWATKIERITSAPGATDSVERVTEVRDVPTWGAGFGLWYAFFDGAIETTDNASRPVTMILDVGVAHRALRGDLGGEKPETEELRNRLLGTGRRNFTGAEVGLTLVFDRIRSSFTYLWLNGHADGLSRGQIVATVELRAPLASGLLERR